MRSTPSILIYIMYIWAFFFSGCNGIEDHETRLSSGIKILGNDVYGFGQQGRSAGKTAFQTGDRILFFSDGTTSPDGCILTFDGKEWVPEKPFGPNGNRKMRYTAVFPVMDTDGEGLFGKEQLYESSGKTLKDVLFCQDSCAYGNVIRLKFRHRFSRIDFNTDSQLSEKVTGMICKTAGIESFCPITGNIIYSRDCHESELHGSEENTYSFIIPPSPAGETPPVELSLTGSGQSICQTTVENITFKEGTAYSCNLKSKGSGRGIYTAEDFIAFTHLINGEAYDDRKLEEFGETADGITTYRLKSDIAFSEEESARIMGIGINYKMNKAFSDIFDGEGHTLSGIRLNRKLNGYSNYGVFGDIAPDGIVRNLNVCNISYTQNGKIAYVGLLAGINRGKIHNCTLQNGSMELTDANQYSGFIAYNQGDVFNCLAENVTISTDDAKDPAAGLVRTNAGNILNCGIGHASFKSPENGAHLCFENKKNIQNCYVYGPEGKYNALCFNTWETSYMAYCYLPDTYKKDFIGNDHNSAYEFILRYDSRTFVLEEGGRKLHEKLNEWIGSTGASAYPELEFCRWKQGDTRPATFILP